MSEHQNRQRLLQLAGVSSVLVWLFRLGFIPNWLLAASAFVLLPAAVVILFLGMTERVREQSHE